MNKMPRRENTFAQIVKYEREKRGWTQQDLADQLVDAGVSSNTVSRWERGIHKPGPYITALICKVFGMTPEELGFISPEEQTIASPQSSVTPKGIEFTIQQGDITSFNADVVALKYAQDFYGTDQIIAYKLADRGIQLENLRPPIGEYRFVATKGSIGARDVLFVGVPKLEDFGYQQIREFSAQVLNILAQETPNTRYLAMTVHGVGFGLDEVEAIHAQFAGYMDAIQNGKFPPTLSYITIVDLNLDRVLRLRQALEKGLANANYASKLGTRWSYLIRTYKSNDSSKKSLSSTRTIETAGIKSDVKPHIFVAMPFTKEMDDVFYYGIQQPVHAAGFLCERVDQDRFIGDILDRIKNKIETAAVVIAELSGANPNVYLEVGYAWGKGRLTLLLTKDVEELRFDVRSQRCLKYERIKDLEDALNKELKELKDMGII